MVDVHAQKVRWLEAQGMEPIGTVLAHPNQGDLDIAIVMSGAVRWLSRAEAWDLMHPAQNQERR